MCLPLGCLKCLVQFSAWITTLVGVGALISAIILTVMEHSDSMNDIQSGGITVGHGLVTTFWIFTGVVLFFGLSGVIGAHKKISCLLFIFNIGNIAIGLAFLILAIVAFIVGAGLGSLDCDITSISNQAYNQGESTFCLTGCECFVNNQEVVNVLKNNSTYIYSTTNTALPQSLSGCPQYVDYNTSMINENNYLEVVESTFKCSGWCSPYSFYVFSNINNGVPQNSCYKSMTEWLQNNGYLIGYISISAACLIGLCILFTCCLCCHPEKKNEGNFYTRMAYYDGQ